MNEELLKYFEKMAKSNRVSHAFLICNTNYENIQQEMTKILQRVFFDKDFNINNCSDVHFIFQENGIISKKNIIDMQKDFKNCSLINRNRVYIIDGAEKFNDSSANCLLKFLEEPEKNIYAFLITSNIDKVISTIKSRCQILFFYNNNIFDINMFSNESIKKLIDLMLIFEEKNVEVLAIKYDVFNNKFEKCELIKFISFYKYLYRDCLNIIINDKCEIFCDNIDLLKCIISKNSIKTLIYKILILNRYESMLEYNLNLNLFIYKLVIELGR